MKTIEELRKEFEETDLFLNYMKSGKLYYSNFGGYRWTSDNSCSFYLNGAFAMFQDAAGTVPVTGVGQPVGLIIELDSLEERPNEFN